MDKHLSPHTAETLERFIGPTERRRGQRKGRLFCATRDKRPATKYNGTTTYYCEALRAELQGLANVFSREKLDPGTRFLLQQLCHFSPVEAAIDLACGNGVLGLTAARQGLAQRVLCCDESAMAFASTRANVERLFPQEANRFNFHHGDGLWGYTGRGADLILCNPPFHREHTVDEFSGQHLIEQCKQHLLPAGQLCIVVNRHLDYLPTLRRSFQRVEKIAANAKFNIFLAGEP